MVVPVLWSWVWCCAKMVSNKKWIFYSRIFITTNHDRVIWRVSNSVTPLLSKKGLLCRPSYAVLNVPYFLWFPWNFNLEMRIKVYRVLMFALDHPCQSIFSMSFQILCYHSLSSNQWDSFMERTSWMFGPFTLYIGCIHFVEWDLYYTCRRPRRRRRRRFFFYKLCMPSIVCCFIDNSINFFWGYNNYSC